MSEVKKIATRDSYGNALAELGTEHDNVVVLDADRQQLQRQVYSRKHIRIVLSIVVLLSLI